MYSLFESEQWLFYAILYPKYVWVVKRNPITLAPTKIVFPRRKEAIRIVSVGYWMTILNVERMSVKSMQRTYVAFCISLLC